MSRVDETLTDHERMLLATFLGERSDHDSGMPASMADGFLTAAISGPRVISPSEWLPEVLSWSDLPEKSSGSRLNAEDAMMLIMRRYNEIARALAKNDVDMLLAVSEVDDEKDGRLYGELWCFGYLNGMSLDPDGWDPLLNDPDAATLLDDIHLLATPFLALDDDGNPDPQHAETYEAFSDLSPQQRSDIAQELPEAVLEIYRFWRDHRQATN